MDEAAEPIALIQKVPCKSWYPQNIINNYDKTIYDVQKTPINYFKI
jgi:hypothetical protein